MRIMPAIKILSAVALLGAGSEFSYRKWQSEPADVYAFTQNFEQLAKKSRNPNMLEFVNSLESNKEQLKQTLKISEEQYNTYRQIAIGIAKGETNCGLDYSCTAKKYFTTICDWLNGEKSLSKGITNFKIDDIGPIERNILAKLKIKDISNPAEAAIATIVHMDVLKKQYPLYLKNIAGDSTEYLTENEYIVARWKGIRLNLKSKDTGIRETALKALKIILKDRKSENPAGYVRKALIYIR